MSLIVRFNPKLSTFNFNLTFHLCDPFQVNQLSFPLFRVLQLKPSLVDIKRRATIYLWYDPVRIGPIQNAHPKI